MEEKSILVLYGSQTGTAEEVAERIWREGKRRQFCIRVKAMDDYDKVGNMAHNAIRTCRRFLMLCRPV